MSILGKRSLLIKAVNDKDLRNGAVIDAATEDATTDPFIGVQVAAAYADVAKDLITHAALTIGGVWAACKIVERICK
jgi:hypothetical protein